MHSAPQQVELLTSWKEIASYLGKGVRTVQRWELQFGLPVRRPNERTKGIVHATRSELDRWLAAQWSQRPKEPADRGNGGVLTKTHQAISASQGALHHSIDLREKNRQLVHQLHRSVASLVQQCEDLARTVPGLIKQQ